VAQADGRSMEIIVVDDCSRDETSTVLHRLARMRPLRIVAGPGRGAAAAINTGVRAARFSIICQVDQDVVLGPGWMRLLTAELEDPMVGAACAIHCTWLPFAAGLLRFIGFQHVTDERLEYPSRDRHGRRLGDSRRLRISPGTLPNSRRPGEASRPAKRGVGAARRSCPRLSFPFGILGYLAIIGRR
jgi:glycosyltransferase involved in cell wall biosynthesis